MFRFGMVRITPTRKREEKMLVKNLTRLSEQKYSICRREYLLWFFLAFLGPTEVSGQDLMPFLDPDQYSDFGSSGLRVRGAATSTAFNEAFEHFAQADYESAMAAI